MGIRGQLLTCGVIVKRIRLAQRRKAAGMSQEKLAELVGVDPSTVRRWEAGTCEPQPWHRPKLADLLEVSKDRLDMLLMDVEFRPQEPLEIAAQPLSGASTTRRQALLSAITAVAGAAGLLDLEQAGGSRRLGVNDIARLDALTALYQTVDREHGGGDLWAEVARFADAVTAMLRQSYPESLAPSLLRSVAAARRLAGWTAFDACRHLDAARHFQAAERAAVAAKDSLLAAQVRYSQALQLQHLRHNEDALAVLRLAQHQLGTAATPAVSAMLGGVEAASLAAVGDRRGALTALGRADEAFGRVNPGREPEWTRFYDRGELLAQYGRVYRDFARHDGRSAEAAVGWVREAIPALGAQQIRSVVLNGVGLCSALFLAGERQEALKVGAGVMKQAGQISSPRVLDRLRNIRRDLMRCREAPDVKDFAHDLKAAGASAAT